MAAGATAGAAVPGRVAMEFHFVDYVVPAWDVAVGPDRVLGLRGAYAPDRSGA
ncbi:hypothetical protein ACWGR4_30080 [Embleya sp. NPDC055664]